jgi:hypothetical protein
MSNKVEPALLTRSELECLLGNSTPSKGQVRFIRYSIRHKLDVFEKLEKPLLIQTGYLPSVSAGTSSVSTGTNAKGCEDLQSEGGVNRETSDNQALDGIRTHDLRFTKPSFTLNNVDLDLF